MDSALGTSAFGSGSASDIYSTLAQSSQTSASRAMAAAQASQSGQAGSSATSQSAAYQLSLSQQAQNQLNGLGQLQSLGGQFSDILTGMESASFTVANGATVDNTNVAVLSSSLDTNYSVEVSQLAQQQRTTAGSFASNTAALGTGTLTLQTGGWSGGSFTPVGSAVSITVDNTNNTLSGLEQAINASSAGITASIIQVGGNYELELEGKETGQLSGFSVSTDAATAAAGNANSLNQLVYNATTQNATQTQAAQDAKYNVNGTAYATASNLSVPVADGINLNLIAAGNLTVSVPQPPTAALDQAQQLIDTVNTLVQSVGQVKSQLLQDNSSNADELVTSLIEVGFSPLSGVDANGNTVTGMLADLGIDQASDGTLTLDKAKLTQVYADDPQGTRSLMLSAMQNFSTSVTAVTTNDPTLQDKIDGLNNQLSDLAASGQTGGNSLYSNDGSSGALGPSWSGM